MNRYTEPYSLFAEHYDDFVGYCQFAQVCRIFDCCVRKHGLRFSCAADFGCGSGLFMRYLASHWPVSVYGVDRSQQMLELASRRCRRLPCKFLLRDYRDVVLPTPVHLITMFSFSLNIEASIASLRRVIQSVWRNLRPGGCWIVDFLTPHQRLLTPLPNKWASARVISRQRKRFCLGVRVRTRRHGEVHEERHCGRLLSAPVIRKLLGVCGFVLIDALDYGSLGPVHHESPGVVFVVRRPADRPC